ncbi:unnamed protein product [Caenorhabditis angaria]|uniref:C-type lectin domain-containing protein n=1 Tax=Caenorhabditis angaria TaxID=860376 RepID=A0A9P1J1Z3_9PELO|nr:unnamed protein product [Caenorhabditis angaria]
MSKNLYTLCAILAACIRCAVRGDTCGPRGRCDLSRGCPDGWKGFQRPYGRMCLKTFTGLVRAGATGCSNYNATLGSMQNDDEKRFVIDDILSQVTVSSGLVWLGINRQPMCYTSTSNADLCAPSARDAFYWTDGSARGWDMFDWHDSAPQLNNCAMMFVSNTSVQVDDGTSGVWYPGQMTDKGCDTINASGALKTIGYVCAKIPNLYSRT